jgi:hypothetical protein
LAEAKAQVLKKAPHKDLTSSLDVLLDERETEADSSERFAVREELCCFVANVKGLVINWR